MHSIKAEYATISSVGRLRRNNEDNFCVDSHIREDLHSVAEDSFSGTVDVDKNALFAVFDGMGGEACGEVASYVAASYSRSFVNENPDGEYLYELAHLLNDKVLEETEERSLVLMGTTAAMLQLAGDTVYILNCGDSRIYKLSSHELRQITKEHTALEHRAKALTKFLGLPKGHELQPYIARGGYRSGDMFILCSDGLTDMVSDSEIKAIADCRRPVEEICRSLVDAALENGGVDNTTVVVVRLK